MSAVALDDRPPQEVAEHLERYARWGQARGETAVLELQAGWGNDDLVEAARDLAPGDVLAILVTGVSRPSARGIVRGLTRPLRATGLEPLGWHRGSDAITCLYARRISPEPGLEESDRGRPPHPPRIPMHPLDAETAVTEDLYALGASRRLCDWMFTQYASHVRGSVAEIGAGIGTFSERILLGGAERLLLVEPSGPCLPVLRERFGNDERVRIVSELLPEAPSLREGAFDLVVCQNVLEHIADDAASMHEIAKSLAPGGHLALLVPAHPRLFGGIDDSYGHFRRYTPVRIRALFDSAGLKLSALYPLNALGIVGWWVKSRRPGTHLDRRSLRAYEALVRIWRPIEDRLPLRWGLSLMAHGQRVDTP